VDRKDPLAPRPAVAVGYHMPDRNTPEYYAMGLIEQMLIEGDDSLLHQELVQKRGLTDSVEGGINLLGNMFDYNGPMLLIAHLTYDPSTKTETVIEAIDTVVEPLRTNPVDQASLDRARVKWRSSLYDTMGQFGGFGLMDLLASFALFDDDPARVNTLVAQFEKVTPAEVQKTAQEYLRPTNRTIVTVEPAPKAPPEAPTKNQ
jgi:predicted Zn-dependent peptidase